ncbi:hyaluronan mediated motility receptor [Polypterus senegalus]|uniref:hyaluronan mediated motility receptor n=1 Tax=Polypterus senegalus TaxID=55291 RepID=UPI0019633B4E|nr:hyaluronan mediated motility receptor [Polypterus senegalus]
MSFPKAPLKRFNENVGCAPPPGTYQVNFLESSTKGPVSFEKSDRFRKKKDAAPGICSTDNEQMAMGKIQRASSIGTLSTPIKKGEKEQLATKETKQQKALEKEVRVLMQQCGEQDKRIRSLEEELKKTEAKLSAALREKTGLAANIASFERQLFDLQKANELLKTKFSDDSSRKKMNSLLGELLEARNIVDAKDKELGYMQINYEGQLKVLETDLDACKSTLSAVQQRNQSLEQMYQEAKFHNEEIENEMDKLHALLHNLRGESKVLQEYLDVANAEVQDLRFELTAKQKEYESRIQMLQSTAEENETVMVFKQAEMEKQLAESENGLKQLKKKLEGLEGHLSTVVCEKEKLERDKADNEQRLSNCLTEIRQLEQSMDKYKGQINDFESMLGDKEKQAEMLKESLEKSKEELSRQSVELQEKSDQLQQEKGKLEVSQGNQEKLEAELKLLTEKLAEAEQQYQQLLDKHNELGNALTEEKDLSTSLRQLLEKMQEEFIQERSQLEGELEEVLEELNILETKEAETEEKIKAIEEENEQKSKTILELQTQLHGKVAKLDRVNDDHDKLIAQLKEEKSSSLRKIGEMETDFERNKLALINEMEVLKDSTSKLQDEIQQLKKLNKEQQEELEATRLSKDKANEEYARMLLDVQTKLAQKENELKKLEGKFVAEIEGLKQVLEDERQQFQKQLQQKDAQRKPDIDEAVLSELQNEREKWKTRYEELYSKVKPFQQQLDAFEAERKALLNENGAAQEEMNKLSDAYAKLLGHQNQKQKIKHVVKLKEENLHLKQEITKLRTELSKEKRLKEQQTQEPRPRRFDPSKAFRHDSKENVRPSNPLKEGNRIVC